MKKILIATAFSPDTQLTLDYVLDLVQDMKAPCKIVLLNTYIVHQTDPTQVISLNDELKKKSKQFLLDTIDEIKLKNPEICIEVMSHMGSLKNVILQVIQQEKFDLVAISKEGGKQVESITALFKDIKCPLLITSPIA